MYDFIFFMIFLYFWMIVLDKVIEILHSKGRPRCFLCRVYFYDFFEFTIGELSVGKFFWKWTTILAFFSVLNVYDYYMDGRYEQCGDRRIEGVLVDIGYGAVREGKTITVFDVNDNEFTFAIDGNSKRNVILDKSLKKEFIGKDVVVVWQRDSPLFTGFIGRAFDDFKHACKIYIDGVLLSDYDKRGAFEWILYVAYIYPLLFCFLFILIAPWGVFFLRD